MDEEAWEWADGSNLREQRDRNEKRMHRSSDLFLRAFYRHRFKKYPVWERG